MTPGKFDLKVYRGDSYAWRVRVWADAAQTEPADLTGATVAAQIRDAPDGTTVVDLDCVIVPPNTIDVTMTPAMWSTAPAKSGVWDLEVTYPDTTVATVLAGKVTVTADVTE